ncbi:MAG: hypothetical protein KKC76_05505 [Proteobacteria bacterium]|nr:hypothetical protein [Pseudomonadota bacterium]MBU4294265.1 hypothetical protein [Pseudomonadota bacterium]MCG2747422.1 hypothetical protein [Desulfobulbaceae bacterium]
MKKADIVPLSPEGAWAHPFSSEKDKNVVVENRNKRLADSLPFFVAINFPPFSLLWRHDASDAVTRNCPHVSAGNILCVLDNPANNI